MNLNPFEALASFVLGVLKQGQIQAWIRVAASFTMSALVTGLFAWGTAILAGAAFLRATAIASIAVAAILVHAWIRHPLTRKLPLFWTGDLETERLKMLEEKQVVSHGVPDEK